MNDLKFVYNLCISSFINSSNYYLIFMDQDLYIYPGITKNLTKTMCGKLKRFISIEI